MSFCSAIIALEYYYVFVTKLFIVLYVYKSVGCNEVWWLCDLKNKKKKDERNKNNEWNQKNKGFFYLIYIVFIYVYN